ncbi:MAG: TetR/AcrR family transcriptional regulator [Proteobacteria bacterium]|nr:TetR/AcrR family transcriptional regulator [Pseudomonadota bacterium]
MSIVRTVGRPKLENRPLELLTTAAELFARQGFDGASIRDIARAAKVQPSSFYHFFRSKEDLFEEVYVEGVRRIRDAVTESIRSDLSPWDRLEAASTAHLTTLLETDYFSIVVAKTIPNGDREIDGRLIVHRDNYEKLFINLIDDLPNTTTRDQKYLRFALFGALNATVQWYRPGQDRPEEIAHNIVRLFRIKLDEQQEK